MVKVYIFNVSERRKKTESAPIWGGSPFAYFEEKARTERGKRREITLAEGEILHFIFTDGYKKEEPDGIFEKGEYGKLKFTNYNEKAPKIDFSIAHTKDTLVVALSDGAPVGIDVEPFERELSDGVEGRFLGGFMPRILPFSDELYEVKKKEANLSLFEITPQKKPPNEAAPLTRWTAMEALVKMSGEGLSACKKANALLDKTELSSFYYCGKNGEKYILTLAVST